MIFLRYSRTLIEANCYILADSPGSPALVVDPGAGSAAWIDQTLQRKGLSLGAVLCTHGHMDHVWDSGLVAGEAPVFIPGPDLYRMDDPVAYARPLGSTFEAASGHGWIKPEGTRALPGEFFADGGAEIVLDGRPLVIPGHEKGHFLGPTIVDNVPLESSLYTEEVFGPVLAIVHADTYEEAIKQVNSSPFGNGAAIFTNDGGVARRFTLDVEAGMVGINVPIPTPVAYYSFGGWKESLLGDTHIHGPEGVKFYTRAKAVTSRWPTEKTYAATMSFQREE